MQASPIAALHRSDCAHLEYLVLENTETGEQELVPDYPGMARLYAEAVASERLPTNRLLVLAAKRYLRMLEMAEDPANEFIYDPLCVVDYCRFAERLQHFESGMWEVTQANEDGTVNRRIVLDPSQIWVESAVQGFRHRITHQRFVTQVFEEAPRKQAKSLKATIAALYDLCCSGGTAPEIPIAAATATQADQTLFGDIVKMVNADDELRDEFSLVVTKDEVKRGDGRIFKLSSQGERQDGLNPSLALFEEGHAGAASVYAVVRSAMGARPGQQLRMITTAGYRPEGPGYELHLEAVRVLEGGPEAEDYAFFAAIWTLDPELYLDPDTKAIDYGRLLSDMSLVERANPMLDVSLDRMQVRADMRAYARRAELRGEFARTRFNIWTSSGLTLIEPSQWAACYQKGLDLEDFFRKPCWIGVDLAQVLDMCAIGLVFEMPGGMIAVFAKFFLPESSPTATDPDMADSYAAWHAAGWLELTPGMLADHDRVEEEVENLCSVFDVQAIACDPEQAHNTAKHLYDGQRPVVIYPNSARTMTAPTDDLLAKVAAQKLVHNGNPVLGWNVQNVHGERKGNGSIMPRKEKPNSKRKIDGWMAITFANGVRINPEMARPTTDDAPQPESPYKNRGIIGFEEMTGGRDDDDDDDE